MTSSTVKTFADFDIDPPIHEALADLGITTPFPIQELTLPLALAGADLIGQARTGTGKTLAFGLPILQRIDTASDDTQALVIVPTRELCLQVHDDLAAAGGKKGVSVVAAYGGRAIDPQSEAIAAGAEVVVGTPGRLLDLMRRGLLRLHTVSTLVLDEADEMLDMGFLPDVEQLIEACPESRQTLLFSATMPSEVVALARRYMRKPTFMRADVEESRVAPETTQHFFAVHRMDKPALVARMLATPERGRCVIFTRTKRMADMLVKDLRDADLNAAAIHSDLRQEAREKTLARFRSGKIDVMCATEVAARGLDIDEVTHVINYDCPDDEKMYLHRIGRTGRAGADGVAVTLAIWSELARLDMIKKALDISEPTLEVFSTSSELDDIFPLPQPDERAAGNGDARSADTGGRRGQPSAKASSGAGGGPRDRGRSDRSGRTSRPTSRRAHHDGDEAAPGQRRRVRRRSRTTSTDQPSGEAEAASDTDTTEVPEEIAAATEHRDAVGDGRDARGSTTDGDGEVVRRRRVRQRATTSRPPTDAGRAGDEAEGDPGTDERTTARTSPGNREDARSGKRRPEDRSRRRRGRRSAPAAARKTGRTDTEESDAPGAGEVSERGADRGARSDRGARGRGGRRNPAASDRPQHSRSGRDTRQEDPAAAVTDAATARGNGRPALRRPFVVSHLP